MENSRFKFRIWDKESQKYHNGMEVFDYMRGVLSPDKYVMEQSTSLRDKNGKLIYEGDWLKTKDGYYCYVVWFDGFWWVKSLPSEAMDLEHSEFYKECEVVGNIHENADLLGEE